MYVRTAHQTTLDRRTMAEIQKKAIKRSKRNPVSRLLHAKNDKDAIAAWKLDLDRILRVFNACYVFAMRLLLTVHMQTELAINNHTMISEIHRNLLKGQESPDDQHQSVSYIDTLFHHQTNNHCCYLDPSQVSYLNCQWIQCLIFACSTPGELPPLHRGHSSDATT